MIIYYVCSENEFGIEVYNGVKEFMEALKNPTPYDNAIDIAVRSCDLYVNAITSKDDLVQQIPNVIANVEASGMNTYFIPRANFISKDTMKSHIKGLIPDVDDATMEMIMFSMSPIAFFGELSEEQLNAEIIEVYSDCDIVEEDWD